MDLDETGCQPRDKYNGCARCKDAAPKLPNNIKNGGLGVKLLSDWDALLNQYKELTVDIPQKIFALVKEYGQIENGSLAHALHNFYNPLPMA